MEANGGFTIIQNEEQKPGLMVLPDWDNDFVRSRLTKTDITICNNCGSEKPQNLALLDGAGKCVHCGEKEWTKAVREK